MLRLIGYAQAGQRVSAELALKRELNEPLNSISPLADCSCPAGGPLPRFDGISTPPPNVASNPLQTQSSGGPIRVPPLTPEKVAQYSSLFEQSGAQAGKLPGKILDRFGE